jgi:pyruvate dehydrogenase E1 component beta subunit
VAETKTYREALREAMVHELDRDENVVLMGEDIGVYGGTHLITDGLYDEYGPSRIMDVPISENGFTGAAVGMAMLGMRPVVEMMTWNFSFLAADQIIQNAAKVRYFSGGAPTVAASSSRPSTRTPWRASTATSPVSRSSRP